MTLIYHQDEDLYEAACDAHALLDRAGECAVKTCFFKAQLTPKGAALFLTHTLHWRFIGQGKDDYLACPDCACEVERLRRQANFAAWWAKKVQPAADAKAAEARERKRLGLPARRSRPASKASATARPPTATAVKSKKRPRGKAERIAPEVLTQND